MKQNKKPRVVLPSNGKCVVFLLIRMCNDRSVCDEGRRAAQKQEREGKSGRERRTYYIKIDLT
jgi:hypothetical protein